MTPTQDATQLARFGFREPAAALRELPGDWSDDASWLRVLEILGEAPDPDAGLRRLGSVEPAITEAVLADPDGHRAVLMVIGFSEYLTGLLVRIDGLAAELAGAAPMERENLRDHRDAGLARVAARDLTSPPTRESFERTGVELADLADDCLTRALASLGSPAGFAVMAMGKYGGRELNYASDIDVLFVSEAADHDEVEALGRRLMATMNGPPTVFRTDADLRPEGRDGPLVRSLAAYAAYYKRWAEVWEFQSLIKCRFAAGDPGVGEAFLDLVRPFVWPEQLEPEAIEQVRVLKARAEEQVARRGLVGRQVKLGPGGIRDVEFAVQLLQLVHGRHRADLRSPTTLAALDTLGAEGYVGRDDASELADAYVFLRHVEHRLQLVRGRQTHTLPKGPANRELLARGLGFRDTPEATALEAFEAEWRRTTTVVRRIHERLFYRPLLEAFIAAPALGPTLAEDEALERLSALGFDRPARAREAIAKLTGGASRRAKIMRAILPGLLRWLSETPDPDAGLLRLVDLAEAAGNLPHLLGTLRDEPPVAELVCRALGTGPVLAGLLERDPSLIGSLSPEPRKDARAVFVREATAIVSRASAPEAAVTALRRFKDGEWVRIASVDLSAGKAPLTFARTAREFSDLADACLEAAVALARSEADERFGGPPPGGFSIIGMGRYGGRELSHASDLDVLFVYELEGHTRDGTEARLYHTAVAERVIALLGATPPIFKVDTELRPEGKDGPLVRSLEGYVQYYERWAALWEFQALLRARHAVGDADLTQRLLGEVAPRVWRSGLGAEEVAEVRRMKARIERERVKAGDPRFDLKLGTGGLADVEFTVQLQQMQHGGHVPRLRTPNTLEAIEALHGLDGVRKEDVAWLRDAYLLLNRVRNHLFVLRGLPTDVIPKRDEDVERLARSLGYGRRGRSRFLEDYRRGTRRARRICDRLFYGADD